MKKFVIIVLTLLFCISTNQMVFAMDSINILDPLPGKTITVSFDYDSKKVKWKSVKNASYYKVSARNTNTNNLYLDNYKTKNNYAKHPIRNLSEKKNEIKFWVGAYNSKDKLIAQTTYYYNLYLNPTVLVLLDEDAVNILGTSYGHLGMAFLCKNKWYYFSNNGVDKEFAKKYKLSNAYSDIGNYGPSNFTFCELSKENLERYNKYICIEDTFLLSNLIKMDIECLSPQDDMFDVLNTNCAWYVIDLLSDANMSIPESKFKGLDIPKDVFSKLARVFGDDILTIDTDYLQDHIKLE